MQHYEVEPHDWRVDVALLGIICIIAITLGLVAHKMTAPPEKPEIARLCANTTGFWLDHHVWADPGFPDYVPCKFLKLEQDV